MNRITAILLITLLSACSDNDYVESKTSKEILAQLKAEDFLSIDFSQFGGPKWTKVCFLGPYNESSEKALGFNWQVSDYTSVLESDGHNVVVFATNNEVIEYVIHSRRDGDFWKISGDCFSREKSTLTRDKENGSRNYVPPKA